MSVQSTFILFLQGFYVCLELSWGSKRSCAEASIPQVESTSIEFTSTSMPITTNRSRERKENFLKAILEPKQNKQGRASKVNVLHFEGDCRCYYLQHKSNCSRKSADQEAVVRSMFLVKTCSPWPTEFSSNVCLQCDAFSICLRPCVESQTVDYTSDCNKLKLHWTGEVFSTPSLATNVVSSEDI